jgi:gliding motility-associated-like protein
MNRSANLSMYRLAKVSMSGLLTIALIFIFSLSMYSQTIVYGEYFFDSDPGVGNGLELSFLPAASINQTFNIPTGILTEGFHTFNARFVDNTGKWSLFTTRTFYIIPNPFSNSPSTNITKAEYFYDNDPGIGNGTNIPVTASSTQNLTINTPTTALSPGFHTANVRVRDDQGRWSLFTTRTFYLMPASASPANLVKLEYYVNTDPGIGQATSVVIAQAPTVNQLFNLNLPVLTPGNYTLNVRAKDSNGYWSSRIAAPFTISACTPPAPPTSPGASRCDVGSATLSASGASGAQVYRWYADASTSTILFTGSSFTSPSINSTTTYYVSIFDPATCESSRVSVVATINPLPNAPTTTGASSCLPNASVTITASGGTNGQYRWYTAPTGGSAIANETNSSFTTPAISVTTTYYVSINNGNCESSRTPVTATIQNCATPPTIDKTELSTGIGGIIIKELVPLITTINNNLDINSISVIVQPPSGAVAFVTNGTLTIDYKNILFAGKESITIRACDTNGNCATQKLDIEVSDEVVVYNAVSANGDDKNPILFLKFIDTLSPSNQVMIYNRWGDEVFSVSDYDNKSRVFAGFTNDGSKLPVGTYFYKVNLLAKGKTLTGFLALKY